VNIALIAPYSMLAYCDNMQYQMMLPDAAVGSPPYRRRYKRYGSNSAKYLMLDNGAWETEAFPPNDLVSLGIDFQAQEIILPDVISPDPWETTRAMDNFFARANLDILSASGRYPKLAAVVHGRSIVQAKNFVNVVADKYAERIGTFCIAKKLPDHCEDVDARAKVAQYILDHYLGGYDIHLLGYNEHIPGELDIPARSMDATTPFTWTLGGFHMYEGTEVQRPVDYFRLPATAFSRSLLQENIAAFVDRAARNA
jgi:hypothetical protein